MGHWTDDSPYYADDATGDDTAGDTADDTVEVVTESGFTAQIPLNTLVAQVTPRPALTTLSKIGPTKFGLKDREFLDREHRRIAGQAFLVFLELESAIQLAEAQNRDYVYVGVASSNERLYWDMSNALLAHLNVPWTFRQIIAITDVQQPGLAVPRTTLVFSRLELRDLARAEATLQAGWIPVFETLKQMYVDYKADRLKSFDLVNTALPLARVSYDNSNHDSFSFIVDAKLKSDT